MFISRHCNLHRQVIFAFLELNVRVILLFIWLGCNVERAHLLSSVIRNIELNSSYYQDTPLDFLAFEGDPLLEKYHQYLKSNGDH